MAAYFVDPQGETVELPDDQARAALAQGYKPAAPDQIAAFKSEDTNQKKYGTVGQGLKAFGEGAADALSFGTSSMIENVLGVDPEEIRNREKYDPWAHGAGFGVGVIGPALATGGGSAAVEGAAAGGLRGAAELTAPALTARLGSAVTRAVAPDGSGALRTIAGKLAGGAAEGAAFGAGDVVGDVGKGKEVTPGGAMEHVAESAALGGGAGGLLGGGEAAIHELGTRKEIVDRVVQYLDETQGMAGLKGAGAIKGDVNRLIRQKGVEGAQAVGRDLFDFGYVGPGKTYAATRDLGREGLAEYGPKIGAMIDEAGAKTEHEALPQVADVVGRARAEVLAPLKRSAYKQEAASKIAGELEFQENRYSGGMLPRDLHEWKGELDEQIYGMRGNMDPFADAYRDALHDVRGIVSRDLDKAIEGAGLDMAAWNDVKRRYGAAKTAVKFAEEGLKREGNNRLSLTELMTGLSGGIAAGPLAGLGAAAGAALLRRQSSNVIGAAAGRLRGLIAGGRRLAPDVAPSAQSLAADAARVVRGERPGEVRIVTPQRPRGEPGRYDVVEADELVPSHKPQSFAPDPRYPAGVQERPYHTSQEEQGKVNKIGRDLNPAMVLSDTPTAVDGPPIVTAGAKRIVLGGNGRTMGIQRAFASPAVRENYKRELAARAQAFGIHPDRVAAMKAPVLVRVAEGVPDTAPREAMQAAVRRFNEGMTQELSPRARAVAEGKVLRPQTVESIGTLLADGGDKSLRDLMRERPKDFITILQRDGLITNENRAALLVDDGLTTVAKDRIEGMFLGRVLGTGQRLDGTAPGVLQKLERITPQILRVEGVNPALSEIPTVQAAIDLMNRAQRAGGSVEDLLRQYGLRGTGGAAAPDAATLAMVKLLETENQAQLAARFTKWAREAAVDPNQGMMFGKPPTAAGARRTLFRGLGASDDALLARVAPAPAEAPALASDGPASATPESIAELAAQVVAPVHAAAERRAAIGYGRHVLTQLATDTPTSTTHGVGQADPEAALERPPREVAEAAVPLALPDLFGKDPTGGQGLAHAVGRSVSPRLVDALGDVQAKVHAQASGEKPDEVRRLLRESAKLGYGGPFASPTTIAERASHALLRAKDPNVREDTAAIVRLARVASRADAAAGKMPLSPEAVSAAWSHGSLAAMGGTALREVRARFGPEVAQALGPGLRKASKAPTDGLVPPEPRHVKQAGVRAQMNEALAQLGGAPHAAPSPAAVVTLAVLARRAEDFARGVDSAATAIVSGRVPEHLHASPLSHADTLALMDRVRRLAADPETFAAALEHHTATLSDHAPQTGQAAATTLSTAAQYLAAQLPEGAPPTLQNPTGGEPSRAAVASWGRQAAALMDPLATLAAGPTPGAAHALQTVYPGAWARWRAGAVNALAEAAAKGEPPPYQTVARVSAMTGQPLTPAQEPALLAIAPVQTPAPQARPPAPAGAAKGAAAEADGLRTGTQRVMAGEQRA